MIFTETQLDLLQETFNIGVGQAAYALSELAGGEEILLTVPEVSIKSVDDLLDNLDSTRTTRFCGVSEVFSGVVPGRAIMLYAQDESLELVRLMLGDSVPVSMLSEMEAEALCEVGNIVLNACISSLANLLEIELHTEVPRLCVGSSEHVVKDFVGPDTRVLVHLKMGFSFAKHNLEGHIGFMMELDSAQGFTKLLDDYFQKILGG